MDRWKFRLAGLDFSNHEVIIAMKSVWIVQYSASDEVRRQKDEYAIK